MGIFWVLVGLRVEVGWLDCTGVKAINNSNKEEEENMVACWGWGRLAGLEAGQSNPSKSVWGKLEAWGRRQPFLGQGRLRLPSWSHLLFRLWLVILMPLLLFSHHIVRSCGVCGTTLRIIGQKRNLTTWKICVQPKKVWGREIAWIGHLVGFLLAHFSFDVYIIQTPWNIILPMWEVYMLRRKTLCSAI